VNPEGLAIRLEKAALSEGFIGAGLVDLVPTLDSELFKQHLARYDAWIKDGSAEKMGYLARGRDRRADPRLVYPSAQSVFCVLSPYSSQPPGHLQPELGPRFARYLTGRDYHEEMVERLERTLHRANTEGTLQWKVCVDTSAVLERTWASFAGLGWIGKNTLLIHPKHGSFTFIGVALLNQTGGEAPKVHPDYCGHCRRCLDGCPTRAFPRERWLDPRKCISSWTLETRGPLPLAPELKRGISNRVAGCDLCQEVCPFNRKALKGSTALEPVSPSPTSWLELLQESPVDYRQRIRPTALSRIKPEEWSRNLAITLRNTLLELTPDKRELLARELYSATLERVEKAAGTDSESEWLETLEVFKDSGK